MLGDWLVVIPARLGSTRLPRKPLADIRGRPMIAWVYDRTRALRDAGATVRVATDSEEIGEVLTKLQIPWAMTAPDHASGTDRCAEVAHMGAWPYVMNLQGDEPMIRGDDLVRLAETMLAKKGSIPIATLAYPSTRAEDLLNPAVVKIARAHDGRALYFSRAPIPFCRDSDTGLPPLPFWHHLGVYAYTKQTLLDFCQRPPSPLEQIERLEQLRALEAGWPIEVVTAQGRSVGIDTPDDLEAARATLLP